MYTLLIAKIQSTNWFIHVDFSLHQMNKEPTLKRVMINIIDQSDCLMAPFTHALSRCKQIPWIKISNVKSHLTP